MSALQRSQQLHHSEEHFPPPTHTHTHTHTLICTHTHTRTHTRNPPVTQYDFLQIPKSAPGWNISVRLPRHFASPFVPFLRSLRSSTLFSFHLRRKPRDISRFPQNNARGRTKTTTSSTQKSRLDKRKPAEARDTFSLDWIRSSGQ